MEKISKHNQSCSEGFTLMELLIYLGVFSVAVGLLVGVLFVVLRIQKQESSSTEVSQQLNFVMQRIQQLVKESSAIIVNSTSTDINNDGQIGFPQSRLVLRMKDSGMNPITDRDPIIIWRDGAANAIKISEGTALNQRVSDLTNNRVVADSLSFTKFTQYPGHDTVSVDMQLTYNTQNIQEKFSRSLHSAIARVSAATFDSDLLPGGAYNYNLGQAGSPWKSLYMADGSAANPSYTFSNDTTLGLFKITGSSTIGFSTQGLERMRIDNNGNVGVGTANPIDKFVQTGNIRMKSFDSRIIGLNSDNAYILGSSGGAAIRFLTDGVDDEIAFETHKIGVSHAERMHITSTGNVGIGTSTPVSKLDVNGTINAGSGSNKGSVIHNPCSVVQQYSNNINWSTAQAFCPANTILTGGGGTCSGYAATLHISYPSSTGNSWLAACGDVNTWGPIPTTAYAICCRTD